MKNKIALVTGASGGIGAAIALRLAADGISIIAHYNSDAHGIHAVVEKIRSKGGEIEIIQADLSKKEGALSIVSKIDNSFGGKFNGNLDILVNNAGTLNLGLITEATDEQFDAVFSVNVRSAFQLSRDAARRMKKNGWGRIINIGSVFGASAPSAGLSVYGASKFALQGFTRAWSRDLGPFGITVNNIQPAVIQQQPLPQEGPTFDAMKKYTSVGRFGSPEEIADAVAFLCQPSSGFINGASLDVDGGWSA